MLKFVKMVGHFCKRLLHKHETLSFTRVNVEALDKIFIMSRSFGGKMGHFR